MQDIMKDFEIFTNSWWPYVISLIISVISAIRFYVAGTYCESPARIDGKIVIITGSSSGIGFETAKELARRGANLILAVRNGERGLKAFEKIRQIKNDVKIQVKLLDVSEFTSIRNFVEQIRDEYEKVDVLINNAGIICDKSKSASEITDITFSTNYLGPFLLTHLLLPLLEKSENGRVINVSALAHFNGKLNLDDNVFCKNSTPHEAFAESKLALTIFTKHMAQLYKHTNITFNSVNPGLVRNTGHLANYSSFGKSFFTKLSVWPWIWLFLKTPYQGCQTIVYLAIEPKLHKVSGCYFSDCEIKEPADIVNDIIVAKSLYEKSCKAVKLEIDNGH
ncbi:retinol dehydrogenase 13-like [Diorhabda sublineata]|uniref:retinol dehydrogenase 13-like n=1 Tax=Diorhabda sublineata TaxID=1163346 RepID=UPI0024E053FF|nr:retinol dehydrogenase 13-like [Diorhabda sublineata]